MSVFISDKGTDKPDDTLLLIFLKSIHNRRTEKFLCQVKKKKNFYYFNWKVPSSSTGKELLNVTIDLLGQLLQRIKNNVDTYLVPFFLLLLQQE